MADASGSRPPPTPRQSGSSSSAARRREVPSNGPDAPHGVAWRLVYDPATDPAPVKRDKAPVYRLAGEGVDSVSDPRPKPGSSAFAEAQSRARSHRHRTTVYRVPPWEHDSNSIGPAPPAPATGITITRLHKLVTHELIYRHFSAYGRIAEAKLHTDPATGGSLGVCWVKYVDEKPTSGTGSSRDLALAKAGQDGHRVAKEAVARSHGAKLGDNAMSIRLDGDGSIAKAAVRHRLDEKAKAATGKGKASAAASDVGSPAVSNVATPRSYAGTPRPTPKLTPSSIAPAPAPAERRPPSPPVGFGVPRSSDAARWRPPPPSRAMWSDRPSDLPPERSQLRPPLRLRNRQSPHRRSPSPPSDDDRGARPFERRDELFDRRARGRDGPRTPSGGHAAGDMRELRLSAQRQLSENGFPHISFSMAPLSSGRHERDISADDLRAHFAAVKPADVFNDGSNWFVTFRSADGARRCHMVMNRQPFRGMALSLSVHESPMRGAPIAGPSTTPGKRSAARPRPPGGWSDAELLREARELIVQELRQTVERDIRTRIVDVKIREAIAKRPRRATDVAAQAKAEPADAMDVDPASPAKKLPSFNKRRPAPSFHRAPSLTPTTTTEVISVRSSESPPPVELEPAPKSRPVKMVPRRRHQIDFSSSESEAEEETVEAKPEPVSEEAEMDVESSEPEIVKPAPKPKKKAGGRKGAKKGKAKAVVKPAAASSDEGEADPAIARRGLASDEDEGTPSTLPTPVPDEIAVSGKLSKSVSPMLRPPTPDPFDPQLAVADDDEDLYYVRLALDRLRTGDAHDLHPDPADAPENAPEQSHMTGSARTEGYYKIPTASKSAYMPLRNKLVEPTTDKAATSAVVSRLARATTRRLVTGIEQAKKTIASDAEIGQFNQLRTRKKQLKFARSPIHDWGLYALETIAAGEMIIEYVGELVRQPVADRREKAYERQGMGSSYLFRVDEEWVVDASKKGSISRLINHCCTPNSIARIVSIQGSKRIVIYAKDQIEPGDEVRRVALASTLTRQILYDYKFARETDQSLRIPCLCGSAGCRGYLN